jgi:hypothetical protein
MFRPYIAFYRLNTETQAQENPKVYILLYLKIDRHSHCTFSQYSYSTTRTIENQA